MNKRGRKLLPLFAIALCACSAIDDLDNFQPEPVICPGYDILSVPVAPPTEASASLANISKDVIDGTNRFAVDFYLANSNLSNDDNVCVSPISVGNVLGMIANGDNGASRDEILSLLGFKTGETGLANLNNYYQTLISNLPNLDETACIFTNSLWYDYRIPIYQSFSQTITKYFYALNLGISPAGVEGMETINRFVEINTYGLIKNLLEKPMDMYVAFLNTTYFKGQWSNSFDKQLTNEQEFVNLDCTLSMVPFMHIKTECEYAIAEDGTEAIRLPYGKEGKNFSMTFILPSSQINHVPLDEALSNGNLQQLENNFKLKELFISIPKFEIENKNDDTIDILKEMGLDNACNPSSGFPLIADYNSAFHLDNFIHATKIIVNEEGAEGAGASIGDENGEPQIIYLDRPFIFLVREQSTDAIIFIGSVKKL